MNSHSRICLFFALVAFALFSAGHLPAQTARVACFPANKAVGVNPDTHLVLTFSSAPTIGQSGQIRVYDAADRSLVDTLDLSIPAGPDPSRRIASPSAPLIDPTPPTPTSTTPAVKTTPADLHSYQLTTIGGLDNFHFFPIIVHGNIATIYPHNNVLHYGRKYLVQIDPGVLLPANEVFPGFSSEHAWTFTTRPTPPAANATRLVVAADGSGDFNTVQGAVDFVPAAPQHRITIFIRNGTYEEIVFFRNKSNLTFLGEDRDKVQVGYGNNSGFNPPMPGPSRRCAFSVYDSTGIELDSFSLTNSFTGQAEGLLIFGSKNTVRNMNITGSGDALNLRGAVYLTDSRIIGDGDTILGVGPAFFKHCELQSIGPFMWIRNTEANHGNVFVDCTFIARNRPVPPVLGMALGATSSSLLPLVSAVFARLPNNHGLNYPYAEAILINCHLKGIPDVGWGPVEADPTHLHLWEFNSTDAEGHPIDIKQRHAASRQLVQPQDAQIVANYSDPTYVLGGWSPTLQN